MRNSNMLKCFFIILSLILSFFIPSDAFIPLLIILLIVYGFLLFKIEGLVFLLLVFYVTSGADFYFISNFGIRFLDIGLILLLLLLLKVKDKQINLSRDSINFFMFMIFFLTVYTVLGSINSDLMTGFSYYIKVIKNIAVFFVSSIILVNFNKETFIRILITNGVAISLLIVNNWIYHSNSLNDVTSFYRSASILGNPNIAGLTICFFTIPLLYMLFKSFNKQYFILLLINMVGIFLTQSRSSLLILVLIFLSLILQYKFKSYSKIKKTTMLTIISVLAYFLINNLDNFTERLQAHGDYDNGRIEALIIGINQIKESLFGTGIGLTSNNDFGQSSHNFIIHSLAEVGIFIVPFIMIIILFLFKQIILSFMYSIKYNIHFLGGLFSLYIILMMFFSHNVLYDTKLYIIIPLFISEKNMRKKHRTTLNNKEG